VGGRALGPVPDEPLSRLAWPHEAASIGAYRELSGFDHPAQPIGPEPVNDDPDRRAAWYEAFACLGPVDGVDVRALPDGTLHLMRESYRTETEWAPRYVTAALRQVRMGAEDAELQAVRRNALARANRERAQEDAAVANAALAASYRAMADTYRSRQMTFEATERDRREWEAITEQPRRLAISNRGARRPIRRVASWLGTRHCSARDANWGAPPAGRRRRRQQPWPVPRRNFGNRG
jgi:hypothetical protein